MKLQKKIFYYVIILTILFQIVSPTAFAANTNKINYLALGDSIAEGYGLSNVTSQRYSSIITNQKSYEGTNLAKSGITCKEFYGHIHDEDTYRNAIKNADVITISIGSNELLKPAIEVIKTATGVQNSDSGEEAINQATAKFKSATITEQFTMLTNIAQGFTSDATKAELDKGVSQYKEYWNKSLSEINTLKKSNATIVVTNFYNPYHVGTLSNILNKFSGPNSLGANSGALAGLTNLGDLANRDLGELFETYITQMNQILSQESNNETNYKIADIKSTLDKHNYFGTPKYTNVSLTISDFNLDPHPNTDGHQAIATQILPYLKSSNTSQNDTDSDNKQDNTKQDDTKQDDNKQSDNKQDNEKQNDNEQDNDKQDNKKQDNSEQDNNTQEGKSTASDSNSSNKGSTTNDSTTLKKDSNFKNDSTIADGKLPQTGITYVSLSLVLIATIIGIYSFIMYKKHKDII